MPPVCSRMYSMSEEGAKILADETDSVSPYDTASLPKEYEAADIGAPRPGSLTSSACSR